MRVHAISDLHLDHEHNLRALQALPAFPGDWLVLAGDIGHQVDHLQQAIDLLQDRFERLVWVPGNHDLWTVFAGLPRGEEKYRQLVDLCRQRGVLTPEDSYQVLHVQGEEYVLAPLFLLYDYSFRPEGVSEERAVAWAAERDILCADEIYLSPSPHASVVDWCGERCEISARRLAEVPGHRRLVLINHFPLREDLIRIRIPRFRIWCGTRRTASWHRRFNVAVVVTGHLHVRATDRIDGVRFEEVSLGYPQQWRAERGVAPYLRRILPEPER